MENELLSEEHTAGQFAALIMLSTQEPDGEVARILDAQLAATVTGNAEGLAGAMLMLVAYLQREAEASRVPFSVPVYVQVAANIMSRSSHWCMNLYDVRHTPVGIVPVRAAKRMWPRFAEAWEQMLEREREGALAENNA